MKTSPAFAVCPCLLQALGLKSLYKHSFRTSQNKKQAGMVASPFSSVNMAGNSSGKFQPKKRASAFVGSEKIQASLLWHLASELVWVLK